SSALLFCHTQRVYRENRQFSRAKDFHKYSENFLEELPKAIVSTKQKPREHSVDTLFTCIEKNIQRNMFLVQRRSTH
ncbi:hypothetical protein P9386_18165, partial [Caldifermentibacillus hisashii]|uniref:hypothetical protein n=1 Tax=Caldifermentibacillus hisashii TaxID=996558 RepID=UPI002E243157|nr:hypothetical protein [Caldifermentibacillus hisashii]